MSDDKLFDDFKRLVLEAEEDDAPLNDDEDLKDELLRQHRDYRFGPDDPRSDEALWAEALKDEQFRAALRGEGSE